VNKRTFLKTSMAVATGGAVLPDSAPAAEKPVGTAEYFELRAISVKPGKQPILDAYLKDALIPAAVRMGCGPVGVFSESTPQGATTVYVLIVHPTAEHFATFASKLAQDRAHQETARDYLAAAASDPVYDRIESSLYRGISGMPNLARTDPSKSRLFNLRIYESHNERAAAKKIEMFNKGELAIFSRVGLTPVFFGETLVGSRAPNLTYLLVFPDEDGRKSAWDRFRQDPDWIKLKAIPEYADKEIVSKITNKILTPASYSQL
jgi:hypothetical protein